MTIKLVNGKPIVVDDSAREQIQVEVKKAVNGKNYVTLESVSSDYFHISPQGNEKTGLAFNFNLAIEYTCNHTVECYKKAICYACNGCYNFVRNQQLYTENVAFLKAHSIEKIISVFQFAIDSNPKTTLFRYFTCGDIPNNKFFSVMVQLAIANPKIKFWAYTKKYKIVNNWIDCNGSLPDNLIIVFSHWLNSDGSYYPMSNPHNLPTSEFIPIGKEALTATVTHICPCSDPTVISTCATCDRPCYKLKPGESMALLEHSTAATKQRDKNIKAAKKALKEVK